jgi:ankyrin repeat protein
VLHAATMFKRSEKEAALLLAKGADVNTRDDKGVTALQIAARWGNYKVAQLLLQMGADIRSRDKQGWTALHMAA